MNTAILSITVTGTPSSPEDADVPGTYHASLPEAVLLRAPADACDMALDAFHQRVAIAELDDFDIAVATADGTVLTPNDDWRAKADLWADFLGKAAEEFPHQGLTDRIAEGPSQDDPRDMELSGAILDALVGVDAPDAKRWYGAGLTFLESLDEALAFAERIHPGRANGLLAEALLESPSGTPKDLARLVTIGVLREAHPAQKR